jgi:membrane-bound serine protease (ClpP class)
MYSLRLRHVLSLLTFCGVVGILPSSGLAEPCGAVVVAPAQMMIAPGTLWHLQRSIERAKRENACALVVTLNTPGGMLNSTQSIVEAFFNSDVPIIVYVSPSGGVAASAGVFVTVAGHIAAMAPGTSLGAAIPISGEGQNLPTDARTKAISMATTMVRAISKERKRESSFAEAAIEKGVSITDKEALEQKVIDLIAPDIDALLLALEGRSLSVKGKEVVLVDIVKARRVTSIPSLRDEVVNSLAEPMIVGLLWLMGTTGLVAELYSPGLIFPGVVGIIALILALLVSQVLSLPLAGGVLIIVGVLLGAAELFVPSGVLAIGGIISLLLGFFSLMSSSETFLSLPVLATVVSVAVTILGACGFVVFKIAQAQRSPPVTGDDLLVRSTAKVYTPFMPLERGANIFGGKVIVAGELWGAVSSEEFSKGVQVKVVKRQDGLTLLVEKCSDSVN